MSIKNEVDGWREKDEDVFAGIQYMKDNTIEFREDFSASYESLMAQAVETGAFFAENAMKWFGARYKNYTIDDILALAAIMQRDFNNMANNKVKLKLKEM